MTRRRVFLFFLALLSPMLHAATPAVYIAEKQAPFEPTYQAVYKALEANRFFVVFEPDIGANLANFGKKWENYNENKLDRIKSMVFCNGWYANLVSNADPDMLGLCPLHITMTHKNGVTKVLFVRPDLVAKGTKAEAVAEELTQGVIEAIEQGMR